MVIVLYGKGYPIYWDDGDPGSLSLDGDSICMWPNKGQAEEWIKKQKKPEKYYVLPLKVV